MFENKFNYLIRTFLIIYSILIIILAFNFNYIQLIDCLGYLFMILINFFYKFLMNK
jgi:hypothetical protein